MFPSSISALSQLRQGDSLPLPLTDQIAFKLRESSHHAKEQMGHGRVLSGEGEVSLFEPHVNAALRKPKDYLSQIVQVAGQPIHRVTDHCVALTHVPGKLIQFRPVDGG